MTENNRLMPDERYMRDATFRTLVDVLEHYIRNAQYTPTELREAAILACVRYEMGKTREIFYILNADLDDNGGVK